MKVQKPLHQNTVYAHLNEDALHKDILLEQLKEATSREGYSFQALSNSIYTISTDKSAPEIALQQLKNLDGFQMALPSKSISLSTDNITQDFIEKKLKMKVASVELAGHNLTHINFDTVEKKQKALKTLLKSRHLKHLVVLELLSTIHPSHHDASTDNSSFSSRSSIESSPVKQQFLLNAKRRLPEIVISEYADNAQQPVATEIEQPLQKQEGSEENQISDEDESASASASSSNSLQQINEEEEVEKNALQQQNVELPLQEVQEVEQQIQEESAQEPQLQKKRKLEQGLQCISLGFQYVLLLTLISMLALRLFKSQPF